MLKFTPRILSYGCIVVAAYVIFLNRFDVLMLKIFFFKYYFNIFPSKNHFENQPLSCSMIRVLKISSRLVKCINLHDKIEGFL